MQTFSTLKIRLKFIQGTYLSNRHSFSKRQGNQTCGAHPVIPVQEIQLPLLQHAFGLQPYSEHHQDIGGSTKFSCWANKCENSQVLGPSL